MKLKQMDGGWPPVELHFVAYWHCIALQDIFYYYPRNARLESLAYSRYFRF